MTRPTSRVVVPLLLSGAGLALAYVAAVRPAHLRWGASDEEARKALPGDEQVPRPMSQATRAVTIRATPDDIWPWVVQMGHRQGGFYSYDALDNRGEPSADRILAEYQARRVGDRVPLTDREDVVITTLEPGRALVWAQHDQAMELGLRFDMSIAYVLEAQDEATTRLICRIRGTVRPSLRGWLYAHGIFEPVDFFMMRKQLLGIRHRAESGRKVLPPQAA